MATRTVGDIAAEIRETWKKPYFGAVPYIDAMLYQDYGLDGEKDVVLRFLCNATTWRGPDAKRVKAELKEIIK